MIGKLTNLIHRARAIRPVAALAVAGFAAILVTGCSQENKIARHTTRADAFFAEGDYDKARIEYLNIVQLDPRNTHAIAQLGNIFFENGVVLQAGAALAQARNLGATDPRISARLGVLLAASRRPDASPEQNELRLKEARESALKALEADPKQEEAILLLADLANDELSSAELKEMLGRLRTQHGNVPVYDTAEAVVALKSRDLEGALARVRKAVDADPGSAAAHYVLAGILLAQTNQVAGEAAFARAAELSPARSTRQIQYVNFLLQRGATNEARAHLDQVIKRAPDFVPGRLRKAQLAFAERDHAGVGAELNAVLTRDPNNIDARLLETQLHLDKREPAKAQPIMEQLLKQFPDSPQLQYQAAQVSLANQNPAQAQLRLDRAYELSPNSPEIVLQRGQLYLARGQAAEVISSMQRLLSTNATVRPAYRLLGEALAVNGEVDRALAVFRDYERRFTDDPAGPQAVGNLLMRKQDAAGARAAFERAQAKRGDYLPALEQLIRLDLIEKKPDAAVARAQAYVDQHPTSADARILLAQALLEVERRPAAEQELERAIELDPAKQAPYLLLAKIYNDTDRRAGALAQLNALIEQQPGHPRALMQLGMLYTEMGDAQKAAESYEPLVKSDNQFTPLALNNLAYLYSEKLNNLDRAYELARRSRQLLPDDASIADTLGWILYHRGEYAQALVHLQESAAKLAQIGEVHYHLGMAHYALANEAPARAAFQLALNLEPQAAWNHEIRDRLEVLDAEVTPASAETLRKLRELVIERKNDVLLLSRLARALESAGQLEESLASYKRAAAVSPDTAMPLIGQARVTAAKGEIQEALSLARRTRDLVKGDPAALYELGRIGFLAGDHAWSYALLQEAAAGLGSSPQVQFAFAQTAIAMGRLEVARGALEKSDGTANAARAALQLRLIPPATAGSLAAPPAEIVRQLTAVPPGELLADYLKARQQALDGQPAGAVKALEQLLETYPQFTPAKRSLASLLAQDSATAAEAEKWARQVRQVQSNDAEMARVLGVAALARKDHRYAADMLQEAARSLTNDGELFLLLGQARAQNQQPAEARQALNRALALPLTAPQKQQAEALLRQLP